MFSGIRAWARMGFGCLELESDQEGVHLHVRSQEANSRVGSVPGTFFYVFDTALVFEHEAGVKRERVSSGALRML